jgi:hypothetical protein
LRRAGSTGFQPARRRPEPEAARERRRGASASDDAPLYHSYLLRERSEPSRRAVEKRILDVGMNGYYLDE